MNQRCDGKADCSEGLDEEDCKLFTTFTGYNENLVPPSVDGKSKFSINISVTIDDIIKINENEGFFHTKYTIIRQWFNPQLTYKNLKADPNLNVLSAEDMNQMWKPWMTLENMRNKDDNEKTDRRDRMLIVTNQEFRFEKSNRNHLHNTELFNGSENAIHLERQLSTNWICNYKMKWYPFDSEICTMQFRHFEDNIELIPIYVNYTGPYELTQHFIKEISICSLHLPKGSGVIVEVIMGRPLFGALLTVFLPTGILVILSHMVKTFSTEYLEMVIEVNLTLLLVLATM